MGYRSIVTIGLGSLIALLLVVSFGSIALLTRMSPAIERILDENVSSLDASEEMLSTLAKQGDTAAPAGEQRQFLDATKRIRANITEPEESPIVERIETRGPRAITGDHMSRVRTIQALIELGDINRSAMMRADQRAKRIGVAGAWAVAFLAAFGIALSWVVLARIRRHLLLPLGELVETLDASARGDTFRRCNAENAPRELAHAMKVANALLDEAAAHAARVKPDDEGHDRAILLHLLDELPKPVAAVDAHGKVIAANQRALARLEEADGPALRRALTDDDAGVERTRIRDADLWFCELPEGAPASRH